MEALASTQFAEILANATVTHDIPADEALKFLERLAIGEIEWPYSGMFEGRRSDDDKVGRQLIF
jgi:hypothetical protein